MQIIREKQNNRAVMMFADDIALELSSCLLSPDLMVSDLTDATHEIATGSAPAQPLYFVAGAMAYDGAWSILDQTAYDALVDGVIAAQLQQAALARASMPALTRRQIRLGLLSIGITSADIEAHIAAITDANEQASALIEWQDASTYDRDHPLLLDVATALALPADQVDALWAWASAL